MCLINIVMFRTSVSDGPSADPAVVRPGGCRKAARLRLSDAPLPRRASVRAVHNNSHSHQNKLTRAWFGKPLPGQGPGGAASQVRAPWFVQS